MNPDDNDENKSKFMYSTDGVNYYPVGELLNPETISFSLELSEEDAAKLYAQLDPLEIINLGE